VCVCVYVCMCLYVCVCVYVCVHKCVIMRASGRDALTDLVDRLNKRFMKDLCVCVCVCACVCHQFLCCRVFVLICVDMCMNTQHNNKTHNKNRQLELAAQATDWLRMASSLKDHVKEVCECVFVCVFVPCV